MGGNAARPGFITFGLMGIYAGWSDTSVLAVTPAKHSAPVLAMGTGGINPALVLNHKELKVASWSLNDNQALETTEDPNTAYGFGSPELAGRAPALQIDPLKTFKANRDTYAEIEAGSQYPGVLRFGATAGNRWSLVMPLLAPADPAVGQRGIYRAENLSLRAINPGLDPSTRDGEAIFCFY